MKLKRRKGQSRKRTHTHTHTPSPSLRIQREQAAHFQNKLWRTGAGQGSQTVTEWWQVWEIFTLTLLSSDPPTARPPGRPVSHTHTHPARFCSQNFLRNLWNVFLRIQDSSWLPNNWRKNTFPTFTYRHLPKIKNSLFNFHLCFCLD